MHKKKKLIRAFFPIYMHTHAYKSRLNASAGATKIVVEIIFDNIDLVL